MKLFHFRKKKKNSFGNQFIEKKPEADALENDTNRKRLYPDYIKYLYEHPETLVEFEFLNRTKNKVTIWVELACVEIDLDELTEYKIVSHDRIFRMEFDKNNFVIFYLQYSFGFKLFKRPVSKEAKDEIEWQLDYDCSDINQIKIK